MICGLEQSFKPSIVGGHDRDITHAHNVHIVFIAIHVEQQIIDCAKSVRL